MASSRITPRPTHPPTPPGSRGQVRRRCFSSSAACRLPPEPARRRRFLRPAFSRWPAPPRPLHLLPSVGDWGGAASGEWPSIASMTTAVLSCFDSLLIQNGFMLTSVFARPCLNPPAAAFILSAAGREPTLNSSQPQPQLHPTPNPLPSRLAGLLPCQASSPPPSTSASPSPPSSTSASAYPTESPPLPRLPPPPGPAFRHRVAYPTGWNPLPSYPASPARCHCRVSPTNHASSATSNPRSASALPSVTACEHHGGCGRSHAGGGGSPPRVPLADLRRGSQRGEGVDMGGRLHRHGRRRHQGPRPEEGAATRRARHPPRRRRLSLGGNDRGLPGQRRLDRPEAVPRCRNSTSSSRSYWCTAGCS